MTPLASSRWAGAALALLLATAGCAPAAGGQGGPSASAQPGGSGGASAVPSAAVGGSAPASVGPRPSSSAVVAITQPAVGASVTGPTVHVVISLSRAQIVQATSTDVRPDQGHVHLYVNNQLVSMNYGLEQDITLQPGTYVLKAEFVASDHVPFNPRVWSPEVYITVTG
jgi:hypothetical protein